MTRLFAADANSVHGNGASRREILRWLAAAGASTVLPPSGLLARAAGAPTGRIDVHQHTVPPFYTKVMEKKISATGHPLPTWTPALAIETMDKNGVAVGMLSPMTRVVQDSFSDKSERARKLARDNNEYTQRLVRDYPGRFGHFAAIPLPDTEGSLREIEYALDTLKADGIGLWTSYGDKWPGDPVFAPVFEELNRRKAIIYSHSAPPLCCRALQPGVIDSVVEYDFDIARAVVSYLESGAFRRYSNIRFIFPHSGGTLPVLANRVSESLPEKRSEEATAALLNDMKQLYFDVAHATYPAPLSALTKIVPVSQILFGSDYPIVPFPVSEGPLDHFGFSAGDLQAINRGNAERLFPRLKA
ncbi:MAG TPA: amidohydrolase family protein [Candidatus Acidoferrales bacterium]|jgi:predicted TIM-barrel fold metal-dependent hydrolase|nr:amidohydrolase family protein [Candidatus Acidoferrales bacterium]